MPPPSPSRIFQPFICSRCQLSSKARPTLPRSSFQRRLLSTNLPKSQARSAFAHLTNRRIIRLAGPDATDFLHNLLPAKILSLEDSSKPIYTAFLSATGRILHDVFLYPPNSAEKADEWLIEVDETSVTDLLKHLRKHKLRSKFKMEAVSEEEMAIMYAWPEVQVGNSHRPHTTFVGGRDDRPGMGSRWVINPNSNAELLEALQSVGATSTDLPSYMLHRMSLGIAEGPKEMTPGASLPQESNLDLYGNSIDFHKGCYVGQELTIRTHHTGVVRKRILPCQIYHPNSTADFENQLMPQYDENEASHLPLPLEGSNMAKLSSKPGRGRSTGKWLGGVGNIGLAICRLEMMTDIQLTADRTGFDPTERYIIRWKVEQEEQGGGLEGQDREVMVKPFVPHWLRAGIEERLQRKQSKAKKRDEEDDEDEEED